ncbi:MAG TPA: TetR/AcrR family transcriptional regulator [Arachnia sp.]|jgi:AcrR family transcriptional regulator|nr:TetR/AcrR family transcriptional regulator [Arachnia sp.]
MLPFAPLITADEAEGPRGKYRKTVQTRARILDAALAVFGEQGFEAGSLREVAKVAGISQAGLLHHYPSKVALLSAVLERRDIQAASGTLTHGGGVRRLAGIIDFARANSAEPFEIDLFAVLSAEATRPEHPANAYMRRRYAWALGELGRTLDDLAAQGHLRPGVDPTETASQLVALWDGLQIQWLLGVGDVDIADRLTRFIDLHLVRPLAELCAESGPETPGEGR